tara:strand:+ start:574 stop:750 length:177 start_codon:yes stop_codon:yes gene_type:complete
MNITDAQYKVDLDGVTKTIIRTTIDGTVYDIPLDPNNRHYAEILKQVKEGKLTIKDAE